MNKLAVISGIGGMDGTYLAKYLISLNYKVIGIVRRTSNVNSERISLLKDIELVYGDVTDGTSIDQIVAKYQPNEFFHLAANSVSKDCLLPIKFSQYIDYISLEELWQNAAAKHSIEIIRSANDVDTEVINFSNNTQTKALGYWNGMGTWFPIKQISRHKYTGKLVKLTQKFGSVTVTPNHSVLDTQQKICQPESNPWLLAVRNLNYQHNQTQSCVHLPYLDIDIEADKLESFCKFIGAYISEGCASYNKCNGSYTVIISNQNKEWLKDIEKAIKNVCDINTHYTTNTKDGFKDVYNLNICGKIFYQCIVKLCGKGFANKKLPKWLFNLSHQYLEIVLQYAVFGDGHIYHRNNGDRISYCTKSNKLAHQFSFLFSILKIDYNVQNNDGAWIFRETKSYQPNQGDRKLEYVEYNDYVYDISVPETENFTIGVGNIVVHNSFVGSSWQSPNHYIETNTMGTINCLEALRKYKKDCKFYFAGSSEMYGDYVRRASNNTILNESSPMIAASPYGVSKVAGYQMTRVYRESYDMFTSCGILFNHSSPLRGEEFFTRKVTSQLARIFWQQQENNKLSVVKLGNLNAYRDEGASQDYVRAMYMMLQYEEPDDFVIATGETHSCLEWVDKSLKWFKTLNSDVVQVDPNLFRPNEVNVLIGDASKARELLHWQPTIGFDELINKMCKYDWHKQSSVPFISKSADQFIF